MAEDKKEAEAEDTQEKATNMIKDAISAAERIEKANAEMKLLVERQEIAFANAKLGGKSSAGETPPVKKEETPQEYAKRIMRGG